MIFADAQPNANTVWIVLIALASFGGNIATIALVFLTNRKQKREVSFSFEPASKDEFEKQRDHCTQRHSQIFTSLERIERSTGSKIDEKIEVVRTDVVAVAREVAGLQSETRLQNQQLARLDTKLDRIIENKL